MKQTANRGIGAVNGTSKTEPFDRWFRYPAGFSKEAREAAVSFIPQRGSVIDPFFGSGSTATSLMGRQVVGIEAHPLIAELAALKFNLVDGDPEQLRSRAQDLCERVRSSYSARSIRTENDLVKRCFSPDVLRQLIEFRDEVADCSDEWAGYLKWALLATLRDVARVKVGWPYQRPGQTRKAPHRDPTARFLWRVNVMAEDLALPGRPTGEVVNGDSRDANTWNQAALSTRFGASVSSPPYLNNFDYADATRLELYFLGEVSTWREMCDSVRADMLIATTQQSSRRSAEKAKSNLERFGKAGNEILDLTERLTNERAKRTRGKEYDQVVPDYFRGISQVLIEMKVKLKRGAKCAWVVGDSAPYGIPVDTPRLIGEIAECCGYSMIKNEEIRSRGMKWRTNGTRHQVRLSERVILFRRGSEKRR